MVLALSLGAAMAAETTTWTVKSSTAARQVTLQASVEAVRQAVLSTQVPGAIVSLSVKAGDKVRAGQELLRVDARAAQQQIVGSNAQLEAAQSQLRVAALELERQKLLFQRQFISQGAMDKAQLQWEAAKAQVDALQANLKVAQVQTGFYVVNAPFAGVVSEVAVVLGDMALPGRPLVTLHTPGDMRLAAAVPQSLIDWIHASSSLQYEIDGVTPGPQKATHRELLPSADPQTRTLVLRIPLPKDWPNLVPGMGAQVHLQGKESASNERIWVPQRAVVERAELRAVRVLDVQGQSRLRQVRLGQSAGDMVEVLSGLRVGEQVVLPGPEVKATGK